VVEGNLRYRRSARTASSTICARRAA
jgi:hypothetical protein